MSVGFTTGAMMANFTGLAAARHHVLAKAGWDVEADGLQGAPRVHVVVGAERHATINAALRFLGLGQGRPHVVPADAQGRMRADLLAEVLAACDGPTIVCAQAGNVNTGAIDPLGEICALAHAHDAWVHVDGAFGLWAAASPALRPLVAGHDRADSWASDAHKWLNVPYDSGLVFVAHPDSHGAAMRKTASYLPVEVDGERDGDAFRPGEFAPGPRPRGVGRPADSGTQRCRRPRRSLLRAGPALRRAAGGGAAASRCSTTSCSTRSWSASADPTS